MACASSADRRQSHAGTPDVGYCLPVRHCSLDLFARPAPEASRFGRSGVATSSCKNPDRHVSSFAPAVMAKSPRSTTRPSFPVNWFVEFTLANFTFHLSAIGSFKAPTTAFGPIKTFLCIRTVENGVVREDY